MFRQLLGVLSIVLLAGCDDVSVGTSGSALPNGRVDLTIVAGSEQAGLIPIIEQFNRLNGVHVDVSFKGSLDIARCLELGTECPYDAAWPAQSLWLRFGDQHHVVKHEKSILRSPVVFGLECPIAEKLGWLNNPNVTLVDFLREHERGTFKFSMTSATQSNSGASTYFAALYAFAGMPDMLMSDEVNDPVVQDKVKQFLASVDRGSGSSGWLKEHYVGNPGAVQAMSNYEAMVIEANIGWTDKHGNHVPGLVEQGRAPLCVIYPSDGMMVADSPLGYLSKGDVAKEELFLKLQQYLLSQDVQQQITSTGRRAGALGLAVNDSNTRVWNPSWGIDTKRAIVPVPTPSREVIPLALDLYQTALRKPSLTVWVLDVSGSMGGSGIRDLREAMFNLFDATTAQRNLLQAGPKDETHIILYNHGIVDTWKVVGNAPQDLQETLEWTQRIRSHGDTDMYQALSYAFDLLRPYHDDGTLHKYLPAVVVMSDGKSSERFQALEKHLNELPYGRDVPMHAIAAGDADQGQLKEVAVLNGGKFFPAKHGLAETLREVKGYN